MNIVTQKMFNNEQIKNIEQHYNAKYLIDSCLKNRKGGWSNQPAAFFYTEKAHPDGSNYFALFYTSNDNIEESLMITNGICIEEQDLVFAVADDGAMIHSRHRHDYQKYKDIIIDGGLDYLRINVDISKLKKYNIKNGEFIEINTS